MAAHGLLRSILNRKSISSSPLLASLIVNGNELPIYSLLALPSLRSLSISPDDLLRFCRQMDSFISGIDHGSLVFAVTFDAHTLCFRNVPKKSNLSQIVATLCGHDRYRIMKKLRCTYVRFEDPSDTFAVWRALNYTPVDGVFLEAEISSTIQQTESSIRPLPVPQPVAQRMTVPVFPNIKVQKPRSLTAKVEILLKPA